MEKEKNSRMTERDLNKKINDLILNELDDDVDYKSLECILEHAAEIQVKFSYFK